MEQILEREKVDYNDLSVESNNEYFEEFGKPLLNGFEQWLIESFHVQLPKKGTEIFDLNDNSFEIWEKITTYNKIQSKSGLVAKLRVSTYNQSPTNKEFDDLKIMIVKIVNLAKS